MTSPSRRQLLAGTTGLLAVTAGCIADDADPTSDENGSDPGSPGNGSDDDGDDGSGDDTEAESDGGGDDLPTYETREFNPMSQELDPDVARASDRDDLEGWLAERDLESDDLLTFVEETVFERSFVVALEAQGSNLASEMELTEVDVDEEAVEIEAVVRDGRDDEEMGSGEAIVRTGQLVRVTFADEPTADVSATIVDQDGEEHGFGISSDEASDSDSDSASDADE